jgi:hypothetical protein
MGVAAAARAAALSPPSRSHMSRPLPKKGILLTFLGRVAVLHPCPDQRPALVQRMLVPIYVYATPV